MAAASLTEQTLQLQTAVDEFKLDDEPGPGPMAAPAGQGWEAICITVN